MKEKSVSVGPALSMPPLSWKYLIDIWGRPMYLLSKDGIFQLMFNFGVSKCFPALLGNFQSKFFLSKEFYAVHLFIPTELNPDF